MLGVQEIGWGEGRERYTKRTVCIVHSATDDLAIAHKHATDRDFISTQRILSHFQSSTYEMMVYLVLVVRKDHLCEHLDWRHLD